MSLLPRVGTSVLQFSFIDALVVGLYDGAFPVSEVTAAADLGLGCGDSLDGEFVLVDGVGYLCRAEGVHRVEAHELLPFAEVARFCPTYTGPLADLTEKQFETLVESLVPSNNLFYAIRVDGTFDSMSVREATRQERPFIGLADAVKSQHETSVANTVGTMVGFKGPDVFQGLSVADFHLHYVDDAREFGGHVMDFALSAGTVSIEAFAGFSLRLPQVSSYLEADLDDVDADEAIRQAEGS